MSNRHNFEQNIIIIALKILRKLSQLIALKSKTEKAKKSYKNMLAVIHSVYFRLSLFFPQSGYSLQEISTHGPEVSKKFQKSLTKSI